MNGFDLDNRTRRLDAGVARSPYDVSAVLRRQVFVLALVLLAAVTIVVLQARPASGVGTVPAGFTQTKVAGGLTSPTAMAFAPDGRLFVAEQGGAVRVVKDGRLLPTPFLVNPDSRGERGLLGMAFDPGFGVSNNYVYVYYTAKRPQIHNRIGRFTAAGDVAVPGSERTILDLNNLSRAQNHNGGAIHFGRDGRLYVAVGENANPDNAQSLKNLLGKMLRINKDGSIPRDNPFYGRTSGKNRAIWARGLRNPYSFAVQPGTGVLFMNDVGQKRWEEINHGVKSANYGWPAFEGPKSNRLYRSPIFAYRHGTGPTTGCAITGGTFYNPPQGNFPQPYVGDYFFADFCSGWIRYRDAATGQVFGFATGLQNPVDLQVGPDGALYYLERGTSSVSAIHSTP